MPRVKLDADGRVSESLSPPQPNPELLRRDPMAELFGPGSGVVKLGDPEDEVPDEVRTMLSEAGIGKKSFMCQLREIPPGTNIGEGLAQNTNTAYIKGWQRQIPTMEYIGKTYGPGFYLLRFSWTGTDEENGGSKKMMQEVTIEISQKYMEEYKKHRLDEKIRNAAEVGSKVHETLIEKKIEGQMVKALTGEEDKPKVDETAAAKKYISETIETAKMIGLTPFAQQQPVPVKSIEWEKILPAVIGGITAFMQIQQQEASRRSEEFNKMMMLMMGQQQQNTNHLLEVMKTQNPAGNSQTAIKEYTDMIHGVIDIKEALSGYGKETLGDKIFRVIEGVAPQILSIAATAASVQAAKANPMVKLAQGYIATDPDFRAIQGNPAEMKKAIDKMDAFFGWKQADMILEVAGWQRPPECARDPAKENPPQPEGASIEGDISEGEITGA